MPTEDAGRKEQAQKIWRSLKRRKLALAVSLTNEQPIIDCIAAQLRRTPRERGR